MLDCLIYIASFILYLAIGAVASFWLVWKRGWVENGRLIEPLRVRPYFVFCYIVIPALWPLFVAIDLIGFLVVYLIIDKK